MTKATSKDYALIGTTVSLQPKAWLPQRGEGPGPFRVVGVDLNRSTHGVLLDVGAGFGHDAASLGKDMICSGDIAKLKHGNHLWWVGANDIVSKSTKKAVKVDETGKPKLSPQCKEILALLEAKGSITSLEAGGVLRARALPRRIADLKEAGFKISRVLSNDTTGQRYARYYLKQAA
jgi:hypothetical protein